jgi:hypothetical protein
MTNTTPKVEKDPVNHPSHYTQYPVEVIELTRHMSFGRGNAVKYIARAGFKGGPEKELEDLEKAEWYLKDEINELKKKLAKKTTTTVYIPNAKFTPIGVTLEDTLDTNVSDLYFGTPKKEQTFEVTVTADSSAATSAKAKG